MGKNRTPKQAQKKFTKHMGMLKHLNKLREEVIKKIDDDVSIAFKKNDHKQKLKELGFYFKSHTYCFDVDTKSDDVIRHFKESPESINFLTKSI